MQVIPPRPENQIPTASCRILPRLPPSNGFEIDRTFCDQSQLVTPLSFFQIVNYRELLQNVS
jgi:hypothetical protein